jgi:hypothetical protein
MDFISKSDFTSLQSNPVAGIPDKSGAKSSSGIFVNNQSKQFDPFNDDDEDIDDPAPAGGVPM